MDDALPAVGRMTPVWVDFFITAGAIALVGLGALIWLFFLRRPKRRRKYRHHHRSRPPNATLAQIGGLPPVRSEDKLSSRPPTTPQP